MAQFNANIDADSLRLRQLLMQIALRKMEGLKLYRPLPYQKAFHESSAHERIIRAGNRGGKTTCAAAEVAMALTNTGPPGRYPESGICYCVGKQGREVAQVLYPKLFKPGAYRIIRDEETNEWRAYNPETDEARKAQSRPALPLVPKRLVKSVAWLDKKLNLPSLITLKNGWQVHFYSSEGKPTQGTAISLVWLDEEIVDSEWYPEMAARLIDNNGRFIWSATPQAGTERLYALSERAREQVEQNIQPRTIEEFYCSIHDNKYISSTDRALFMEKLKEDEETFAVRIKGEFAILSGRVFPEYVPRLLEIEPFAIPHAWTRYVAIDPGRQVCAALFAAVPPPEEGDFVYFYDELYIKGATAAMFGKEMGEKAKTQQFYEFLIDMHEVRKRSGGDGKSILEYYIQELRENKCRSLTTGYDFLAANDNVQAGLEAIRFWMRIRADGNMKMRVFRSLVNFNREMRHYRYQRGVKDGEYLEKPVKKRDHLIDCARYIVQRAPVWVAPAGPSVQHSAPYRWWLKERKKKDADGQILLGAGGYDVR